MRCIKLFVALSFNWKQMFSRDRKVVYIDKKVTYQWLNTLSILEKIKKKRKKNTCLPQIFLIVKILERVCQYLKCLRSITRSFSTDFNRTHRKSKNQCHSTRTEITIVACICKKHDQFILANEVFNLTNAVSIKTKPRGRLKNCNMKI